MCLTGDCHIGLLSTDLLQLPAFLAVYSQEEFVHVTSCVRIVSLFFVRLLILYLCPNLVYFRTSLNI